MHVTSGSIWRAYSIMWYVNEVGAEIHWEPTATGVQRAFAKVSCLQS